MNHVCALSSSLPHVQGVRQRKGTESLVINWARNGNFNSRLSTKEEICTINEKRNGICLFSWGDQREKGKADC